MTSKKIPCYIRWGDGIDKAWVTGKVGKKLSVVLQSWSPGDCEYPYFYTLRVDGKYHREKMDCRRSPYLDFEYPNRELEEKRRKAHMDWVKKQ
jgi:hypothetical protein